MSENIIQISEVKRDISKFVIGLAGQSGEGKTYSALQLAYGLANFHANKIGFLDTENGRASFYSDVFGADKFLHGNLIPPFSPDRYIQAMRQFAESGIEVLIIDSYSHVWEGTGGCEEIAHAPKKRRISP